MGLYIPEEAAILEMFYWQYLSSLEVPLWGPLNCSRGALSRGSFSVVHLWSSLDCVPPSSVCIHLHPSLGILLPVSSESFQKSAEKTGQSQFVVIRCQACLIINTFLNMYPWEINSPLKIEPLYSCPACWTVLLSPRSWEFHFNLGQTCSQHLLTSLSIGCLATVLS